MEKAVSITLIIVLGVLALGWLGFSYLSPDSQNKISVSGYGQVQAVPDNVAIYFNVETKGPDAKSAKDNSSEIVDKVLTSLLNLGVNRDEIDTSQFNLYQDYEWTQDGRKDNGYRSTHSIIVKIEANRLRDVGALVDAGIDNGALVNYINFELSTAKQNEYKALALEQATADAKNKAEAIAKGAGKKVGNIISIESNDFSYQPWRMYDMVTTTAESAQLKTQLTDITPGQREISGSVSITYQIK